MERQRYSSCSSSSNISRTPSVSSLDDGGGGGGGGIAVPGAGGSGAALDIQQKRYKDVCYGSPYKRVSGRVMISKLDMCMHTRIHRHTDTQTHMHPALAHTNTQTHPASCAWAHNALEGV